MTSPQGQHGIPDHYDTRTRSMLTTDRKATGVSEQDKGFQSTADGSVDVWSGPLEPWFDRIRRPGAIAPLP